jgi:tetratricopeptide (TPR) repeat protein
VTIRARFGHALHRHAIYDQLLPTRRLMWHARIGVRKAAAWEVDTRPIAAELAAHFSRAGDLQRAIRYHVEAGQVAWRQQAHHVAAAQYTAALEMVARLPDTPERARQEAGIWMSLGEACMAAKGYAAPEVEQAYAQALALCQKTAEAPHLFPTLYGLWGFHLTRGECRTAQELGERMLRVAQQGRDGDLLVQAHQAVGLTCYFRGENLPARNHLQQALDLCRVGRASRPCVPVRLRPRDRVLALHGMAPVGARICRPGVAM